MKRKIAFFALAMVVAFAGMVTVASAASSNLGHIDQKGSLLIWPKIMVFNSQTVDKARIITQIFIGNDYYTDVWVKCYWVDKDQQIQDFMFRLTPNQPVSFYAETGVNDETGGLGVVTVPPFAGGDNATGELKCWAVDASGENQISFNHLYGSAWISSQLDEQWHTNMIYNAYAFAAKPALGAKVGTAGQILLNGVQYDACPLYLVANFEPPSVGDLTLVPCRQDLRQDRSPTCTKAKFDVWNSNETKFTGAYQCIKCWWEGILEEIKAPSGYGGDKFSFRTLNTYAARFRVQGIASSVCKGQPSAACTTSQASPLIGLFAYTTGATDGTIWGGHMPAGVGIDTSGYVYWDPAGGSPEAPTR